MKLYFYELKRMMGDFRFWISIIITLSFFFRVLQLLRPVEFIRESSILRTVNDFIAFGGFTAFAIIPPCIPSSTLFCEEVTTGFNRPIIMRIGSEKYVRMRVFTTMFSGGFSLFIAFSILFLFISFLGIPEERSSDFGRGQIWNPIFRYGGYVLVLTLKALLAFLFGSICSLSALLVSTIILNPYITLIFPFVIYEALWILMITYLPDIQQYFNPALLLQADLADTGTFFGSVPYIICYQLVWIIILCIITKNRMRKRLVNS